jgi:hypothetical protein
LIVTIHWNWSVFSAVGLPSVSGYSIADGIRFVMKTLIAVDLVNGHASHYLDHTTTGRPPDKAAKATAATG